MILSDHPSISLEQLLSDASEGMLIWNNQILDLREISKFHINLKRNYSKLTLEQYATDTPDKDYSNDIHSSVTPSKDPK